jgi:hypothetical protein
MEHFADIFSRIETLRPTGPLIEVWKRIDDNCHKCKITGKELNRVQFERYQNAKGGPWYFVVEV